MKKRFLKKSDVLREGYIKGLKHAQRIINEAAIDGEEDWNDEEYVNTELPDEDGRAENPFEGTEEWELLDEDDRDMIEAYLEYFDAGQTLQQTLEEAQERYVGTFYDWEEFGQNEFTNGGIDAQWLLDMNCIDWEQVGYILSNDYHRYENGMTFRA